MPIYTETIKQLLYEDDIEKMWNSAKYESQRVILSILWYSGARPIEVMNLKRKNVTWGIDDNGMDYFQMELETKKLAKTVGFVVSTRILTSSRPLGMNANRYVETMIRWAMKLHDPEAYMIVGGRTTRWLNKEMHRLSAAAGHVWCVYNLRHSVLSHLSRSGNCSLTDLMHWKGASHPSSVMRYVHAAPVYIQIENQRRERDLFSKPRKPNMERYHAEVLQRPASKEEIEKLPLAEKEKPAKEENE